MTVIGPPVRLGNRPRRDGRDPSCADQRLADDPWTEARGAALRGSRGIPEACRPGEGIVLGREQPDHLDLARDLLDLRPGIGAVPHRPGVDLLLAQVESR